MSTLQDIGQGLTRAWDSLAAGWHELRERASHALTRFHPRAPGALETAEDVLVGRASRWGLIPAEVSLDETSVTVRLEAPGMSAGDFDIAVVQGDTLVVRGEKRMEQESWRGTFYVMERAYGSFERAVPLPLPVEEAGGSARYRDGVLTISLPRRHSARARRIEVTQG